MQTHDASPAADLARPLAGWEVAARWNRATFDWMAQGWQQWIALMTTLPPRFVVPNTVTPAQPGAQKARGAHAAARAEPQRAARAKPKSKTKSKKTTSARTRG
jgi:hypothetical protein